MRYAMTVALLLVVACGGTDRPSQAEVREVVSAEMRGQSPRQITEVTEMVVNDCDEMDDRTFAMFISMARADNPMVYGFFEFACPDRF